MRLRNGGLVAALILGGLAVVVPGANAGAADAAFVVPASAAESDKTVRVEVPEAGISIAYPASWKDTTKARQSEDDEWRRDHPDIADSLDPLRLTARNVRGVGAFQITTSVPTILPEPGAREPTLQQLIADQRDQAKYLHEEFLSAEKQPIDDMVGWRGDFGRRAKVKGKTYTSRRAELTLYFPAESPDGPKNVFVRVYGPLDATGEKEADRVLHSIKLLPA
jgi:hypothetical protein